MFDNTRFKCEACSWPGDGSRAAGNHENQKHDGAQTCWPVELLATALAMEAHYEDDR